MGKRVGLRDNDQNFLISHVYQINGKNYYAYVVIDREKIKRHVEEAVQEAERGGKKAFGSGAVTVIPQDVEEYNQSQQTAVPLDKK